MAGPPRPPALEEDETRARREALKPEREVRQFPGKFDVREPAWHVSDIERPLTQHLIGDVDITAPDILRLGLHFTEAHAPSIAVA